MRTTLRLPDDLVAEVKKVAADTGRTLTAVIEDALREILGRRNRDERRQPVRLTTVGGDGPLPGVDLDDSASLLELMESGGAADRR